LFHADERRLVDIAKGEIVEAEIDAFINRRDKQRRKEEERPAEEIYADSVRRHHERQQLQRAWEWLRYHEGPARPARTGLWREK